MEIEMKIPHNRLNLVGIKFGYLTAKRIAYRKNGVLIWECDCDCGSTHYAKGYLLKAGVVKSCGCKSSFMKAKHSTTHGLSRTRKHRIWTNMKSRCYNPNIPGYRYYGGKGIKVDFENFEDFDLWATNNGYRDDLTIDRIDHNSNYSKENCRWITHSENASRAAKQKRIKHENK